MTPAKAIRLPPALLLGAYLLDRSHRRPVREAGAWIIDVGRRFETALMTDGAAFQSEAMRVREDVMRLAAGEQVPTQSDTALRGALASGIVGRRDLLRIIDGWQLYFVRQRYRDWRQLETMARQLGGGSALLLGALAGAPGDEDAWSEAITEWGAGVLLVGLWTRLDASLDRGRLPFPEEDMERLGAGGADFADGRRTKGVQDLLWYEFKRARELLAHEPEVTAPLSKDAAKLVRATTAWSHELMARIEEGGANPYDAGAELGRIETARLLLKS